MIINYDLDRLNDLLKNFYELAHTRIVVFNDEFHKIAQYPAQDCPFCALIRSRQLADSACDQSDRLACETARLKRGLHIYICHAGLTESVAPVTSGNLIIGYIMFGQVRRDEDEDRHWEHIRSRCAAYGLNEPDMKRAFMSLRPVRASQIYAASQILEACAGYLWTSRLVSLSEESLPRQIDHYITNNLDSNLSSSSLCNKFQISRSQLYRLAIEYYGVSIDRFVRIARIRQAKHLLVSTDLPLSEIAYKSGYGDYNYFIKVFKKTTGKTPSVYRNHPKGI